MLPYKSLSSKNLGFLLLIVRATTVLSLFFILMSVLLMCYFALFSPVLNANFFIMPMILIISISIVVLLSAGILAALIGFEESYRKKVEREL